MALFDGIQEDTQEQRCHSDTDGIRHGGVVDDGAVSGLVVDELTQTLVAQQEVGGRHGAHEGSGNSRQPVVLLIVEQIHGGSPQHDHRQRLVGPAEVTPDDGIVDGAQSITHTQNSADTQHGHTQQQTVLPLLLVQLEPVGQHQTGAAEGRIARGDGAGNHAQHGQRHTDLTHGLDAHIVNGSRLTVGQNLGQSGIQATGDLIQGASGSGPHQRNDTLGNHGAVEHEVTLLLALHAASHQGALRGMEAGDSTAGHGDEHEAPHGGSAGMHGAEVVPQLGNGVLRLDKDTDDHAHRHNDQADTKQGINLADDLVDGQEGGDEVIDQHDNQPEQRGGDDTVGAAVLEQGDDQAGRANSKHRTHHNQQHHAEHTHDVLHEAAQIDAGDLGDGGTVVALAHHTGEIVVDAASEDGAEGDPQEHDGAPQSTLQSAEDGTEARNVQQLDHEQLPLGQDYIVHAVVDLYGRRFTVVGAEGVLHDLAVQEVAADQQSKTDQKTNHIVSSLHNDIKGLPGCSPGAARGNSRSAGTFFAQI
ncbi:unknown [Eggerthella sp. CAG:1427]|nr:unknown [Eggerthella sp. CAG:1427]